jgi:hypothetical protein
MKPQPMSNTNFQSNLYENHISVAARSSTFGLGSTKYADQVPCGPRPQVRVYVPLQAAVIRYFLSSPFGPVVLNA